MNDGSVLLKQVDFVSPEGIKKGDILVENGKIIEIEPVINKEAELVINERGVTVLPGCIDPHVHFREPGATHKEDIQSGSKAAAAGGVTSFFEMPNTNPAATTNAVINQKKEIAKRSSLVNYNFFIGATASNCDELKNAENVAGIKIYVGSSTGNLLVNNEDQLKKIFKETTQLIAVHSEEESIIQANYETYKNSKDCHDFIKIRTTEAAVTCTKKLLSLATETKRRLHICHLSTAEEIPLINAVSQWVTTEVSMQHLLLSAPTIYDKIGTFAQINPPIRENYHKEALFSALKSGEITCIASDHAPHTIEEKSQPFGKAPSGMPGVETTLPLLLTLYNQGKCSLDELSLWTSGSACNIFNIKNKGKIKVGYDADFVIVDLAAKKQIQNNKIFSKCKWSAFEGWDCHGWPIATIVNGNMIFREGDFFDEVKGTEIQIKS